MLAVAELYLANMLGAKLKGLFDVRMQWVLENVSVSMTNFPEGIFVFFFSCIIYKLCTSSHLIFKTVSTR